LGCGPGAPEQQFEKNRQGQEEREDAQPQFKPSRKSS
jgi:hypothetical protein